MFPLEEEAEFTDNGEAEGFSELGLSGMEAKGIKYGGQFSPAKILSSSSTERGYLCKR